MTPERESTVLDHRQPQRAAEAWRHFAETPLDRLLTHAEAGGDPRAGAIALFHDMLAHVPAYRSFLAERNIDPAVIRVPADLDRLPLMTKANYVQRYPLAELVRGGKLAGGPCRRQNLERVGSRVAQGGAALGRLRRGAGRQEGGGEDNGQRPAHASPPCGTK